MAAGDADGENQPGQADDAGGCHFEPFIRCNVFRIAQDMESPKMNSNGSNDDDNDNDQHQHWTIERADKPTVMPKDLPPCSPSRSALPSSRRGSTSGCPDL